MMLWDCLVNGSVMVEEADVSLTLKSRNLSRMILEVKLEAEEAFLALPVAQRVSFVFVFVLLGLLDSIAGFFTGDHGSPSTALTIGGGFSVKSFNSTIEESGGV